MKPFNYYQLKNAIKAGLFTDTNGELDANFACAIASGSVAKHFIGIRELSAKHA